MIVDSAVYVDGRRTETCPLAGTCRVCRERGGFAWVGLYEPTEEEFGSVMREFGLQGLATGDATKAHQRPKLERHGDCLSLVLKSARYVDETETVEFGEILAFVGDDFIVTVRHGEASALRDVRQRVESNPDLLRRGPAAVLYAVMDRVVEDYGPVIEGLENDIDEIETEVFGGEPDVSRRVYGLFREVIQFHRATRPLAATLGHLIEGEGQDLDPEVKRHLYAVRDHVLQVTEQVEAFRELLTSILSVNLTLVSVEQNGRTQEQNEQVRRISAWGAILVVPTIIASIYGMNFRYMPELGWLLGYPYALALMVAISGVLYLGFKRSGWL